MEAACMQKSNAGRRRPSGAFGFARCVCMPASLLSSFSCHGTATITEPSSEQGSGRISAQTDCDPARTTQLRYELEGVPTRLAFARAMIGDLPTSLLVDTGATDHVLAGWFVRKLGVPTYPSAVDETTDHDGRELPSYRARNLSIEIEGWGEIFRGDPLVVDLPEMFEQQGVAGFLAPQLMRPSGQSLILDLERSAIALVSATCARSRMENAPGCWMSSQPLRSCVPPNATVGPIFAATVAIEDRWGRLVIDTGSTESDVFESSAIGANIGPGQHPSAEAYVASGHSPASVANPSNIVVGECRVTQQLVIDPGRAGRLCQRDGAIGMDLLRSCVLVVDDEGMSARCSRFVASRTD